MRPWSFVIQRQSGSDHSCFAAYKATLNGLEGSMFTRLRRFPVPFDFRYLNLPVESRFYL